MAKSLPTRSSIEKKYTWNAESVFPTAAAWKAELTAVLAELPGLAAVQEAMRRDAAGLADGLAATEKLQARMMRVFMYAHFSYSADTADGKAAAKNDEAQGAFGRVTAACAFVEPLLLSLGKATLEEWTRAEPRLAPYRHSFDNLYRRQAHVRSAEVEEIIGMLVDPFCGPENTSAMLLNADLRFADAKDASGRKREVSQGSVFRLMEETERSVRRSAWESYMAGHFSVRHTLASALATSIKQSVFRSRARRFESSLEATLDPDNIPTAVFHNAIDAFRGNLPLWHRYFDLRRKVLKLKGLNHFDMWAPLTRTHPRIPYEKAVEMICDGLAPLGSEYVQTMRRGCLTDRWVDVYPNKGKREGAFSGGSPGTHPFIMMSWTEDVTSLGTLAHELGHSMHSLYAWRTQPFTYAAYSTFVAEVASNFHQALVRAWLLEHEPSLQVPVIEEAIATFFRYFFIMPTLARFELATHGRVEEGQPLTADVMMDTMTELLKEAYGPAVSVERDREGMLWASFPHLYMDYYVFQYETGISGANALAERVRAGAPGAADAYVRFISAGASGYPADILRKAGVDLSRPEPVQEAFTVMGRYIQKLEELLL